MPITITDVIARDIRFPTSRTLDGSDAMNRSPTTRPPTSCSRPTARTASRATA